MAPSSSPSQLPIAGKPLPRAENAVGVRRKLSTYALDKTHEKGGPKARGFERILGITLDDIDYLENQIHDGILIAPISKVLPNAPYGINCVVEFPLRGLGAKRHRTATLRTVWKVEVANECPRLVTVYIKS